jgi:F-type H+-transporting ATPase subunit gamma
VATTLSDIKRRINTTTQIRKVTGTLQKVASAKLTQDLRRIANANVYYHSICRLLRLADSALPADTPPHPLMTRQEGDTIALIVFGSDRGLCGAFNTLLMNEVHGFVKAHPHKRVHLLCRGKVVYRRALRLKMEPLEKIAETSEIDHRVISDFVDRKFSEVHMLYWDYVTGVTQNVVSEQVLPTPFTEKKAHLPGAPQETLSRYGTDMIEPSPTSLMEALLPEYVRCSIHNGFYNSLVTENAQRQASMARATDNAGEMLGTLRKTYSRLRQENITTEMLEIVAGLNR